MGILLAALIFSCAFASVALITWQLLPAGAKQFKVFGDRQVAQTAETMDAMFLPVLSKNRLILIHAASAVAVAGIALIFVQKAVLIAAAAVIGMLLPAIIVKIQDKRRRENFDKQLVDGLMILSSSLRGGLSMLQSIEVLVDEMPIPLSEEFGLVLREHKMGVNLQDALENLNKRIHSKRFNLVMTAILIARETGGNIAEVFGRLVDSMRQTNKLEDKVKTLTIQGKMQGLIMSLLPIVFGVVVYSSNPQFLEQMFLNPMGKTLLIAAVILEVIGSILIIKLSKVDI